MASPSNMADIQPSGSLDPRGLKNNRGTGTNEKYVNLPLAPGVLPRKYEATIYGKKNLHAPKKKDSKTTSGETYPSNEILLKRNTTLIERGVVYPVKPNIKLEVIRGTENRWGIMEHKTSQNRVPDPTVNLANKKVSSSDFYQHRKELYSLAQNTYEISQQTPKTFTDLSGLPNSSLYYFAKLYEIITKNEVALTKGKFIKDNKILRLQHPDFLLEFIPIFYNMYKTNLDLFLKNKYDNNISPHWYLYFKEASQFNDTSNLHFQKVIKFGVGAHIKGDMATALAKAYKIFFKQHPDIPFEELKNDFFEINRPVFEKVLSQFQSHLRDIKRPLETGIADKELLWFAGSRWGSILAGNINIDEVFHWREDAWNAANDFLINKK